MNINFQVKEAHVVIADDKGEVALAYSINNVDMDLNVPLALKLLSGVMKQIMKLNNLEDDTTAEAYTTAAERAVARGFTTAL